MLSELKVSHFAIIDNVHICFQSGLNILSGETGAGKSILLKSLGLLMGEKSSSESVRSGQDQAVVEGSFDLSEREDILGVLSEMGIDVSDGTLIVRRVISSQGKNRIYINNALSTLSALQNLVAPLIEVTGPAAPLIEMTGQHENRSLLSKNYHLDAVDLVAQVHTQRRAYAVQYKRYLEIVKEIERLENESRDRAQRLDFLKFQQSEIRALDLKPGEESELENNYKRLRHSTRLIEFAETADQVLSVDEDAVLKRLQKVLGKAQECALLDPSIAEKVEPLHQAKASIEDVSYELQKYLTSFEDGREGMATIEERLSQLRKLQKKFGSTAEEILTQLASIETEIETLENSDDTLTVLRKERLDLQKSLNEEAEALHKKRIAGARKLAEGVNKELNDLNMKGVIFSVSIHELKDLGPSGKTDIEFMIQPSPKDEPRAMAKIASGGELSRILLSLKQVVGVSEMPRTYLFDEVDTGVSGTTAEKVGRKLKSIAQGQQVICVTHLPQVASFGDAHFFIQKSASSRGVQMEVIELEPKERVKEIARLISGEKITKTSLDHAAQLLRETLTL